LSNNSPEEDRKVIIGLLKFVATGITVTAAIIGIASAIGQARSLEPTYVYTIPATFMSPQPENEHPPATEQTPYQQNQVTQYAY